MNRIGKSTKYLTLGLLVSAALQAVALGAEPPAPTDAARAILADALVQDARARSRDGHLPTTLAARQACVLLQAANQLDPANPATLRLLADAATAAKKPVVLRDALRQTVKIDPANLVAQVTYLDLIAEETQTLEQRAHIYQAALDKTALDPQVRSEMAVRLASIVFERGDVDQARIYLKTALDLNDVNVTALQWYVKLSSQATPSERFANVAGLLAADPYQPDQWALGASLLAAANLHSLAADWYIIATDQSRRDGVTPPAEEYLGLAAELAIAGRRNEAEPRLRQLTALPDAPVYSLIIAQCFSQEFPWRDTFAPATAPAAAPATATQPQDIATQLRDKLMADLKADPKNAKLLGETLWTLTALLPDPGPDFPVWLETYRSLVPADDGVLARIEAWKNLRAADYALAREHLLAVAKPDVFGQIALARAQAALHKTDEARKILQDVYNTHPTGLAAILVAQSARAAGIHLAETPLSRELLESLKRIPPANFSAYLQPRDLVLITATPTKRRYAMGEPIMLTIKQSNTTDHALPVGPAGVVRTTVGITGATRGMDAQPLGMFATDDCPRAYRLDRRASLQYDVRVDQGLLADLFEMNPVRTFTVGLMILTNPRGDARSFGFGLGGQNVNTTDVEKSGLPFHSLADVSKALAALPALPQEQKMTTAWSLSIILSGISAQAAVSPDAPAGDGPNVQADLNSALTSLANSDSPVTVAWMMRTSPRKNIPPELSKALDKMPATGEAAQPFASIARLLWAERYAAISDAGPADDRTAAAARLKDLASHEGDPLLKEWFDLLVEELNLPARTTAPHASSSQPASATPPATQTRSTPLDSNFSTPTSTQRANP